MTEEYSSNRGRPKGTVKKDDLHVSVDQELSVYYRLKFLDPLTGKTRVGALSELVNRLLRDEFVREQGFTSKAKP